MTEAQVSTALVHNLRAELPHAVVFKHWDHLTVMPDISVTWQGRVTWLEVKLVKVGTALNQRGNQALMMRQLITTYPRGAYYVIYTLEPKETRIVHPSDITDWSNRRPYAGHNHEAVGTFIRRLTEDM